LAAHTANPKFGLAVASMAVSAIEIDRSAAQSLFAVSFFRRI
jgi:hypothetical protein